MVVTSDYVLIVYFTGMNILSLHHVLGATEDYVLIVYFTDSQSERAYVPSS